jgi:hypothetical protein
MNNTKSLAIVAVLTAAVVVGIFGARLVQPASAQQCASASSSVAGSASSSAEAHQKSGNTPAFCSTTAEATPPEDSDPDSDQ